MQLFPKAKALAVSEIVTHPGGYESHGYATTNAEHCLLFVSTLSTQRTTPERK